jgi:hypothetical protein
VAEGNSPNSATYNAESEVRWFVRMNGDSLTDLVNSLEPLLPIQKSRAGHPANDHRTIFNGVLWNDRTNAL